MWHGQCLFGRLLENPKCCENRLRSNIWILNKCKLLNRWAKRLHVTLLSWFYLLFQCFFWLKRTVSLVMETGGIVLNIYFIQYHSCSASAFAIPFCEQFYRIIYHRGCIILYVSMPPLPARFQQRFRKGVWVGKSKLGHKFVILCEFPYWSCWLVVFSVFLLLGLAEP